MEGLDLNQAISNLAHMADEPGKARGCRVSLVSYVWIDTLLHYWPSKETSELSALRATFRFLKEEERSRFLKQRRIVLGKLSRLFGD
jgi:hypothetical protein